MSEWMRGMGWLVVGVGVTMVTDGFGTFSRPEEVPAPSAPHASSEPPPETPDLVERGAADRPPPAVPPGKKSEAPPTTHEESIRALQEQMDRLERLLSERRARRSSDATREEPTPGPARQAPGESPWGALGEQLLADGGQALPGTDGMKVDAETQKQVMQIVRDLQRQLESGQLDRQRQIDEVMKNNP